jgi:predicted TIM-barrel fold metal-dependent hydrolase
MRQVFDAHLHIIDSRFPSIPNKDYLPDLFTVKDYLNRIRELEILGGVVVSGSFQGFDQSYLIDALKRLGQRFVGVTQLPPTVSDEEVVQLNEAGVRAVRFNLYRGGSADLVDLEWLAPRVHELAEWHVELYVDSKDLLELEERLAALPKLSIDHLGMTQDGYAVLLRLVERGAKVKATGFGRLGLDVRRAIREISSVDPEALMFGTDLPGTRAERPFEVADIDLIVETLGDTMADMVLYKNAKNWYAPRVY